VRGKLLTAPEDWRSVYLNMSNCCSRLAIALAIPTFLAVLVPRVAESQS
jgi:hypothetical protein